MKRTANPVNGKNRADARFHFSLYSRRILGYNKLNETYEMRV